jgi:GntR family transcriptional regulator
VIPFRLSFEPGVPVYEQVVYAAKKAIISGNMVAGERFPSVRALSQALKINPNTAHKVIGTLVSEGLLEVLPGLGTVVATSRSFTEADRTYLLETEVERLVVEAKRLGLTFDALVNGLAKQWSRIERPALAAKEHR